MESTTKPAPKPERRSHIDGLTNTERESLRDPLAYIVIRAGQHSWEVFHRTAPADFRVTLLPDGSFSVLSNTGGVYRTTTATCGCPHHFKTEATCKHMAVLQAVLLGEVSRQDAAAAVERQRQARAGERVAA